MDLLIRPANRQDTETLYRFICALEEATIDPTNFRAIFWHNLADPRVHYLVAEENGEVIGFASCHVQYLLHHAGKVGEIQELFVRPDRRNRRIGRRLVEAMEALAHRERFVNLEVATNQKRAETYRFYQQMTFNPSHFKLVKPLS